MVEEIFDEAGSGDPEAQDIGDEIPDEENIESEDILDQVKRWINDPN